MEHYIGASRLFDSGAIRVAVLSPVPDEKLDKFTAHMMDRTGRISVTQEEAITSAITDLQKIFQ